MEHKSRQTWREKIGALRQTTRALGRPDFLLANNEYGLGKASAFAGVSFITSSQTPSTHSTLPRCFCCFLRSHWKLIEVRSFVCATRIGQDSTRAW